MVPLRVKVGTEIHRVLRDLPKKADYEIRQIAQSAAALEGGGFKIRGACAAELLGRSKKLKGGRGKKDVARVGRKAFIEELANELGVTARTLQEDISIYDRLVKIAPDIETEDADILDIDRLGREYYRAALLYADPYRALQGAARRRGEGSFTAQQMRDEAHPEKAKPSTAARSSTTAAQGDRTPAPILTLEETEQRFIAQMLGAEVSGQLSLLVEAYNAAHPLDAPVSPPAFIGRLVFQEAERTGLFLTEPLQIAA